LLSAGAAGNLDLVHLLLTAGADVNAASPFPPLHIAALHGHFHVVQLLLCKGASPQLRSCLQHTALLYVVKREGPTEVVRQMLEAWGQHQIAAQDLVEAAWGAADRKQWRTLAVLARELRQLYPTDAMLLFAVDYYDRIEVLPALAAVLDARASDVSSQKQRAALHKREEVVAKEQQALQHLIVGVAGMAKAAGQRPKPSAQQCQ
jgi:ankyrin repeat protein